MLPQIEDMDDRPLNIAIADMSSFDSFPGQENVTIAIGKGHQYVPRGTLCIGNCTAQHKKQGIFVAGCPPVAMFELHFLRALKYLEGKTESK